MKKSGGEYGVGDLCARSGLSRSALLYYDSIGLLAPSGRKPNNYRYYTEADLARLDRVLAYREAGVPLEAIKSLLSSPSGDPASDILRERLQAINESIRTLRAQRELTLHLLRAQATAENSGDSRGAVGGDGPDGDGAFLEVLSRLGLTDAQRARLHRDFESIAPKGHERFLRFIGLGDEEIRAIRARSLEREKPP